MDNYKETFETWNKVAELYQNKFMDLTIYDETYDLFLRSLNKKNAQVLEIGCGPGNIARYLLTKQPELQLLGTDVAPTMVELASKNNPTATFDVMDAREIGQLTTKFDGIISGFCLPYLNEKDAEKLISDCSHLLAEQGTLYLSFVEGEETKSGFQTGSSGDRVYFHYYELSEMERLLNQNGFENLIVLNVNYSRNEQTSEIHTIIIAKKR